MSLWNKAKGILGAVAPTIGTALGGPLGGIAVRELAGVLGLPVDAPEEKVAQAVASASPEQLLAIKQAEIAFQTRLAELDVSLEEIHQKDRNSARERQVKMNDWTPAILGSMVLVCWGSMQWFLITADAPPAVGEVVLTRILGMLDAASLAVIYFFFGSSKSSKDKTEQMAGMMNK